MKSYETKLLRPQLLAFELVQKTRLAYYIITQIFNIVIFFSYIYSDRKFYYFFKEKRIIIN